MVNMHPTYQTEDPTSARREYCEIRSGPIVMLALLVWGPVLCPPRVDPTMPRRIPQPRDLSPWRKKGGGHTRSLAAVSSLFTGVRGRGVLGTSPPLLGCPCAPIIERRGYNQID